MYRYQGVFERTGIAALFTRAGFCLWWLWWKKSNHCRKLVGIVKKGLKHGEWERKVTSEPVFGIIKAVMGFRSFLLRGCEAVHGEWNLVCMAWNIKRLHALTR